MLDRLTVTVPTGHVGCIETSHRLVLDDHVFQHLVVGGAHVDVSIGVRGPVVEHERYAVPRLLEGRAVHIDLVPEAQPVRFTGTQVRAHRKLRLREVHRALVVLLLRHRLPGPLTVNHCLNTKKHARPHLGRSVPLLRSHSAVPPSLRTSYEAAPLGRPITGTHRRRLLDPPGVVRVEAPG